MINEREIGSFITDYRRTRGRARQAVNAKIMALDDKEIARIRHRAAATCKPCPKYGCLHEPGEPCL